MRIGCALQGAVHSEGLVRPLGVVDLNPVAVDAGGVPLRLYAVVM